jgi:hypothetical protein
VLGLGIAVGKGLVVPARERHNKNLASIRDRVSTIARYETYKREQGKTDAEMLQLGEQLKKWEKGLLEGDSTSAAGIFLQGLLKPLTTKPQTRLTSIRALTPVRKGPYSEIAVQLDIQTSTEDFAQILSDISRQPKSLKVRKFNVNSGSYSIRQQQPQHREVVTVSVVVSGLSKAPLEDKQATAGRTP